MTLSCNACSCAARTFDSSLGRKRPTVEPQTAASRHCPSASTKQSRSADMVDHAPGGRNCSNTYARRWSHPAFGCAAALQHIYMLRGGADEQLGTGVRPYEQQDTHDPFRGVSA